MADKPTIESVLTEERTFPPSAEFAQNAYVKSFEEYEKMYSEAEADLPAFWAKQAEALDWFAPWEKVLEWEPPHAKW
ncbi:MAG: hypothetical protein K1X52_15495, partial [Pyrinomonadaceae bacterium]|nr:hypothetical protein [Pyrinomonadaceae bacterium]